MIPITAIILAKNEENYLAWCISSVSWADEVLVVDARSRDGTAEIAEQAGVCVVQEDELSSEFGPARGKGDAMWRALRVLGSEIVAFADTDTEELGEQFLTGLLGPLICDASVHFVKGFFRRPFRTEGTLMPHGGDWAERLDRLDAPGGPGSDASLG